MNRIAMMLGAVAITTPSLWASMVYTSQNRSIRARAEAGLGSIVDEHTITAPDFGPFDQTVSAEAIDPFTMVSGWGRAHQQSVLDPFHIAVNGQWSGGRTGQGASGGGTCGFGVNFTLNEAVDYVFTATAVPGMFFSFGGSNGFSLSDLGTYSGTLAPGDYWMTASMSGSAGFPPSGGGFTLDLAIVPGPGALGLLAAAAVARRRR